MIDTKTIYINDIDIDNTTFDFENVISSKNIGENDIKNMEILYKTNIMQNIFLYESAYDKYIILDGFKRYIYLKETKQYRNAKIQTNIVKNDADKLTVAKTILFIKKNQILNSMATKSKYIKGLIDLKVNKDLIRSHILKNIEIPETKTAIDDLMLIANLPKDQHNFINEKKLSFKQSIVFSMIDQKIRNYIFMIKDQLYLSLSNIIELAVNIDYITKKNSITLDQLLDDDKLKTILSNNKTDPKTKKYLMLALLDSYKNPEVTKINNKIKNMIDKLNLDNLITVKWDHSIELKELEIMVKIIDPDKIDEQVSMLKKNDFIKTMKQIIDLI